MRRRAPSWIVAAAVWAVLIPAPSWAQGVSLLRDTEIEDVLHSYADPLLTAAGQPPASVEINLVGDPSINAFVAGGRQIFIHTGLITQAETPNQIKGVLAHEIGHIAGGHIIRSADGVRASLTPVLLTLGAGLVAAVTGHSDAAAGLLINSQYFGELSYLKFSRTQESAADQAGMSYLEDTQQSGEGLLGFFEKFRYQEVMSEARRFPYFRSHPLSSDRIAALRSRIAHQGKTTADSADDIAHFKLMQAKIEGFMNPPNQTFVKFKATDTSQPARYARAIAYYRNAELDKALPLIDGLISDSPNNAYFYELKGQMLFEFGRAADAVAPHKRAAELAPGKPLLMLNLAQAQIGAGNDALLPAAVSTLRQVLVLEPDNGFAWSQLAMAYDRQGEDGLARLSAAEARFAAHDFDQAKVFAIRARETLTPGSPEYRRAADLVLAAKPKKDDLERLGENSNGPLK
jgi:predicted Zn-dependent protease